MRWRRFQAWMIALALGLSLLAGCGRGMAAETALPSDSAGSPEATRQSPGTGGSPTMFVPTEQEEPPTTAPETPPPGCPPECAGATLYKVKWPNRDLAGADLSGAYLRLADLRDANLEGASLVIAQLDGANLTGARLGGASLRGAHLRPALRDGPTCPGAEDVLEGSNACPARLSKADLSGADLSDADMADANLAGAILREADLSGTDLRRAILRGADLTGADLREADLRGADLIDANLSDADLWEADLREAKVAEEQLAEALVTRGGVPAGMPMACSDYEPPGNSGPTWNIETAPDASVWVSAYRGLARFDLRTGGWIPFTEEDGLLSDQVRSMTIEADGSVWLALREGGGAARYDGFVWTYYTTEDGLISNKVSEVSVAQDGSVWFATTEGVSHWDRETDSWTSYTEEGELHSNDVWRVLFTPDGRIWFVHPAALTSLLPASAEDEVAVWDVHGGARFLGSTEAMVSQDGRLWLGQVYWDPEKADWVDTVYRDLEVLDLAVDDGGGLWIARPDGAIYLPDPGASPPEAWQHYGIAEGLPDDRITVITLEGENAVWFGTMLGVSRCIVGHGALPPGTPTQLP